jgi:predicted O-methyltransferase YrrM
MITFRSIIDYMMKEQKLSKLLGKSIRPYYKELRSFRLSTEGFDNVTLGSMDTPLRGPTLYVIVRAINPSIVVETGVASGASSVYVLKAMKVNCSKGRLYSIDEPNLDNGALLPQGKSVGWLVPQDLRMKWTLIMGRSSSKLIPLLEELGQIDMFLHDSEHTYDNMMYELSTAWKYLKKKGVLCADDICMTDAFHDFVQKVAPSKILTLGNFGVLIK